MNRQPTSILALLTAGLLAGPLAGCSDDARGSGENNASTNPNSSTNGSSTNGGSNSGSTNGSSAGGGGLSTVPFAACAGADPFAPLGPLACFGAVGLPGAVADGPLSVIEHAYVTYEGQPAVHLRLTLNPNFVDNVYAPETADGWERRHDFKSLKGSDHSEILVLDADGNVVFELKLDYISDDPDAPCGYSSLGVSGGDGEVVVGDPALVLGWSSSLDRNLNERGYCDFIDASPLTDENCTPNPDAPDWDYRVVYEVWLARSAFDPIGFGTAHMTFVHASPAKGGENTVDVEREECSCPEDDLECGTYTPPNNSTNGGGGTNGGGTNGGVVPGTPCTSTAECGDNAFCYDGACLPVIL